MFDELQATDSGTASWTMPTFIQHHQASIVNCVGSSEFRDLVAENVVF